MLDTTKSHLKRLAARLAAGIGAMALASAAHAGALPVRSALKW